MEVVVFLLLAAVICDVVVVEMQMLAKLVSGIHKPDDQTVLLPIAATGFMTQLPLRAIPGDISSSPPHYLHILGAISSTCH